MASETLSSENVVITVCVLMIVACIAIGLWLPKKTITESRHTIDERRAAELCANQNLTFKVAYQDKRVECWQEDGTLAVLCSPEIPKNTSIYANCLDGLEFEDGGYVYQLHAKDYKNAQVTTQPQSVSVEDEFCLADCMADNQAGSCVVTQYYECLVSCEEWPGCTKDHCRDQSDRCVMDLEATCGVKCGVDPAQILGTMSYKYRVMGW